MMTPSEVRQSTWVLWIKTPVRAGPARVKDAACLSAIRAAHKNRGASGERCKYGERDGDCDDPGVFL